MEEAVFGVPVLLLRAFSGTAKRAGDSIVPVWNIHTNVSKEAVGALCDWMRKRCRDTEYELDTKDLTTIQYLGLWHAVKVLSIKDAGEQLEKQAKDVMSRAGIRDVVQGFRFLYKRAVHYPNFEPSAALRARMQAPVSGEALGRILHLQEVEYLFNAQDFPFPSSKQKAIILAANQIWEDDYHTRRERISCLRTALRKRFENVWNQLEKGTPAVGTVLQSRRKKKVQEERNQSHARTLELLLSRC